MFIICTAFANAPNNLTFLGIEIVFPTNEVSNLIYFWKQTQLLCPIIDLYFEFFVFYIEIFDI